MGTKVIRKFLLIGLLGITSLANAVDMFDGSKPRPFNLADQVPIAATIGGYPIWQGERKWRLFDISAQNSNGSATPVALGLIRMFQTEGKKLVAVMTVSANLAESNGADWTDEPCKRDNMLFKASTGGKFTNINCATINHITNYQSNPGGNSAELFALFKDQGVEVPPTLIQLAFTRYTNNSRRLVINLYINPDMAGIPQDLETSWARNSWHKTQAFNDPVKKRFIDSLSVWAIGFQKQMDDAFDKKQGAFLSIPTWRSATTAQPLADQTRPKITLD